MNVPYCKICERYSKLQTGKEVYPHRPDLSAKFFYVCLTCLAKVGCHPETKCPLGTLCDKETQGLRKLLHKELDTLWLGKEAKMSRKKSYTLLAAFLDIPVERCHIGEFDKGMCKKAIRYLKEERK